MKRFQIGTTVAFCAVLWGLQPNCGAAQPVGGPQAAGKDEAANTVGDAAWEQVKKALIPPPQPAEWRTTPPTKEQMAEFEKRNGTLAAAAADKAKDFYTKFPSHARAQEARGLELKLLMVAIELGNTNRQPQLDALLEKRLNDPAVPGDEKFRVRAQRIVSLINDESGDPAATLAKAEKAARELQRDFPKKDETFDLLLMLANGYLDQENLQKARQIVEEVDKNGPAEAKEQAQTQLRKIDRVGKPLELSFADLKGKHIDIKDYTGKVVLVDFWATWCGPCVAALPELKETYLKYHPKGLEVMGISLDKEKDTLEKFLRDENMTWPQHFDGGGWESDLVRKFEIEGIPTMWLVDKKGKLRSLAGRVNLAQKVQQLLSE